MRIKDFPTMIRLCLLTLAVCIGSIQLVSPSLVFAGEIVVLTPKEDTTVTSRRTVRNLILMVSDKNEAQGMQLRKSGNDAILEPVGVWNHNESAFVHYRITLRKGINTFEIKPHGKTFKIKFRPIRTVRNIDFKDPAVHAFHRDKPLPSSCTPCHEGQQNFSEIEVSPYGAPSTSCFTCHKDLVKESDWRHSPAVGVLCKACHQEDKGKNKIVVHTDDIDSLCYRCHIIGSKWDDYASVHGPVGTGDCTVCHDPHGDTYRYFLWADGKLDLCLACHRDKKKLFAADSPFKSVHGIIKGAGCTVCHSPHASKYQFQLHKSINSLCLGCHAAIEELEDNHPVEGHPVEGVDDPNRSGREMSCTSCHKPHGSQYSLLLIGENIGGQVCSKCHS